MYAAMTRLIEGLEGHQMTPEILGWACPVPFFGEISGSPVATIGINPSNREFVDSGGTELAEPDRRLPTLASMRIATWSQASGRDVREITRSCERYFDNNPYRLWFDVLERMLNAGGASYYRGTRACHIDLVPFATWDKWGVLSSHLRRALLEQGRLTMAQLVHDSPIQIIVLNGRSVVEEFKGFAEVSLTAVLVEEWTLPRAAGGGVAGIMYEGVISSIADVELDREIVIIGYNHNLQSSFGVTTEVMRRIGERVGEAIVDATID